MGQQLVTNMGLNFLRDGIDWANLVSMNSVNGQPYNWNFISKDFSNQVWPAGRVQIQSLAAKLAMYTQYVQNVGLFNMGAIDQKCAKANKNMFHILYSSSLKNSWIRYYTWNTWKKSDIICPIDLNGAKKC